MYKNKYVSIFLLFGCLFSSQLFAQEDWLGNNPERMDILKFDFSAPFMGYTQLSWEHSFAAKGSLEVGVGLVALGVNNPVNRYATNDDGTVATPSGFSIRAGYKFFKIDKTTCDPRGYSHPLDGTYLKGEMAFSMYNFFAKNDDGVLTNVSVSSLGLLVYFGKQWILDNRFCTDLSIGLGPCLSLSGDNEADKYTGGNQFSFFSGGTVVPVGGNVSLKIGYLFNIHKRDKH